MLKGILSKVIGSANEKELRRLQPIVERINALEPEIEPLTDAELRARTDVFRERIAAATAPARARLEARRADLELDLKQGDAIQREKDRLALEKLEEELRDAEEKILWEILPEAFAVVREVAKRTVYMGHFDVQLMGGIVLHQGKVAEMKTGEGKTLVAPLAAYLNALTGHGVHVVTVNDYLARRDVQWMGPIYHLLGLRVGLLQSGGEAFIFDPTYRRGKYMHLRPCARREAYLADVTYGTNHEFGFDYLRDNLAYDLADRVQRELHYAIVDEVDNILIDEARTPLIISGPADEPLEEYERFARIARKLHPDIDYEIDERERRVTLTEAGLAKVEKEAGIENIYDEANYKYVHYMEQALKAQVLFHEGRDYIKQHGRIILVDQFTGRLMPDRRLSDGLHQAIEAKEGVKIRPRMMTYATITIQNYFRLYDKLAGMTGTAATEAEEFYAIYGLDVVVIPTNRPMIRIDYPDVVYRTEKAKWEAIVREIEECYRAGRPVLVGTTSIEKSERLSKALKARGIRHQVLHAKKHAEEAKIIARAGEPGAVTIATQMAGRGVDIKLGGELPVETLKAAHEVLRERGINPFRATPAQLDSAIAVVDPDYARRREQVLALGGLHIIGTERHEARRIDNQLRGRAGRQGDPGSSRFYLSLEDELMRRFGGERASSFMERLGVEDDIPIEHNLISKVIENAQTRMEGYNFDIRKHLLEYDDVLNRQRELIYEQRYHILTSEDLRADVWAMIEEEIDQRLASEFEEDWEFMAYLDQIIPLSLPPRDSPFRYPFSLLGRLNCLPPFTILFLAGQIAEHPPEDLAQELMEISQRAVERYRAYLLEKVVGERLEREEERYEEWRDRYAEKLEEKVNDYVELAEERGVAISYHQILQHLQRVFPLPLKVNPSRLRGLELDEVIDELLAALDVVYHHMVCERLLNGIRVRLPQGVNLENVRPADLDQEAVRNWLAQAVAHDEQAASRLVRVRENVERGRYRGNLVSLISEVASLASFPIGSLRPLLEQAVTREYDRWAERQLAEISRKVGELGGWEVGRLEDAYVSGPPTFQPSNFPISQFSIPPQLVQVLLDVFYTEKRGYDREHRQRAFPAPRLPLAFLALAEHEKHERHEGRERGDRQGLRQVALTYLERAFAERERLWGEQELARIGQQRIGDLNDDAYEGLVRAFGEERVRQSQEKRIADLEADIYEDLRYYLWLHQIEEQRLADLEIGDEILAHLSQALERRVLESRIADLDEDLRQRVEDTFREQGFFEDAGAEQRILQQRLGDLDKKTYESLAARVGHDLLAPLKARPIAELDADLRQDVEHFFRRRGYFVDEEQMQQFFVHGRLRDLGDEAVREACLYLAREQLGRLKDRRIGNLPKDIRDGVLHYLREAGLLVDEARQQGFPTLRLSDLDSATRAGLTQHLGSWLLDDKRIADLDEDLRRGLIRHLREHFVDEARQEALGEQKLTDLGPDIYERVRERLLEELRENLERPIGELPDDLRERIRGYLDETGYFINEAKVRAFRQRPLTALKADVLHGLEKHLGREFMTTLEGKKFLNLEQDIRESILQYIDKKGHLKGKAERQRFIQRGSLTDLPPEVYDDVAHHLGRRLLSEVKGLHFSQLPEEMRHAVWHYLVGQGYFADEELVELFPLMSVAELEAEVQEALVPRLQQDLEKALAEQEIAALPESVRASVYRILDEMD